MRKFTIAYYLLLLYTTAIFQPLIVIATDAWSHTFAEANHIATVHVKYGIHHLDASLEKANSNDTKHQQKMKVDDNSRVHIPVNNPGDHFPKPLSDLPFDAIRHSDLLNVFILKHTPPPKYF